MAFKAGKVSLLALERLILKVEDVGLVPEKACEL